MGITKKSSAFLLLILTLLSTGLTNNAHASLHDYHCTVHKFFSTRYGNYDARYIYLAKFVEEYYFMGISNKGNLKKKHYEKLIQSQNLQMAILVNSFYRLSGSSQDKVLDIRKLLSDPYSPFMEIIGFAPDWKGHIHGEFSHPETAFLLINPRDNELLDMIDEVYKSKLTGLKHDTANSLARDSFIKSLKSKKIKSEYISNAKVYLAISNLLKNEMFNYGRGTFCRYSGAYSSVIYNEKIRRDPCQDVTWDREEYYPTLLYRNVGHWNKCLSYKNIQKKIVKKILSTMRRDKK